MDFSDFEYVGDHDEVEISEVPSSVIGNNVRKVRGADRNWEEIEKFQSAKDFADSKIMETVKEKFSLRKTKAYEYADVKEYECMQGKKDTNNVQLK